MYKLEETESSISAIETEIFKDYMNNHIKY